MNKSISLYHYLTYGEVKQCRDFGAKKNLANKLAPESVRTVRRYKGYGGMAYYSSDIYGYVDSNLVTSDCSIEYKDSDVKYVLDNLVVDKFELNDLIVDLNGYLSSSNMFATYVNFRPVVTLKKSAIE